MWDMCNQEQITQKDDRGLVIALRPNTQEVFSKQAENLQRILLGLGYLQKESFDPTRSWGENSLRESQIVYL